MPRSKEQFEEIRNKTKENILNASLKLFAEKGFHGTSINDIAKAAKISKGLTYNYFDSKQKIVEALFAKAFDVTKFLEIEISKIEDPYEKLKFLIESTLNMSKNNDEYWRLYISMALQPEIIETAKIMTMGFFNSFIGGIEMLFKSIGIKNAHYEARMFAALFDGLGLQYMIDNDNFPFDEMKEYFLKKYSKEGIEALKKLS
jgi:AcrR family transcriptional regulator